MRYTHCGAASRVDFRRLMYTSGFISKLCQILYADYTSRKHARIPVESGGGGRVDAVAIY